MNQRRILYLIFGLCTVFGWCQQVDAHSNGETLQLSQANIGSHSLSVWSAPSYLRPGEVHFSAMVVDQASKPVTGCTVEIWLESLDSVAQPVHLLTRAATSVTQFKHEIEYPLWSSGRYRVTVFVLEGANPIGSANFDIEIEPISIWMQLPIYLAVLFASIAILLLGKQAISLFNLWQPPQQPVRPARRRHIGK